MKLSDTKFVIFAALFAGFAVACDDDMGSDDSSFEKVDEEETVTDTSTVTEEDSESQIESDTSSATEDASDEDSDSSLSTDPSTDEEETLTASDTDTESPVGQFGDSCETGDDCEDGVCHDFGQIGLACTLECKDDIDCPEGSEGQKCNKQGVCRP